MFGRISQSHSLSNAILLKKDNKNVSPKTLRKIAQKIVAIKNSSHEKSFALKMKETCYALQQLDKHNVYQKIGGIIAAHSKDYAYTYNKILLDEKQQADETTNYYDTLTLPLLCQKESQRSHGKIVEFSSIDALFACIEKLPHAHFKAITKMTKKTGVDQGHYACIDVAKKAGKTALIVYEPTYVQHDADANADYGLNALREAVKERIANNKLDPQHTGIGFVEMGVQSRPNNSAIFALTTANKLFAYQKTAAYMFAQLQASGDRFTRFYLQGTSRPVSPADKNMIKTLLPAEFYKHASSLSEIKRQDIAGHIINNKYDTLTQWIERHMHATDSGTYSNSIELKRQQYLRRINQNSAEKQG